MGNSFGTYIALQAFKAAVRISNSHYVVASWDEKAHVWYVRESSVPGLSLEAASWDELVNKLDVAIPELLELNDKHGKDGRHPIPLRTIFNDRIHST